MEVLVYDDDCGFCTWAAEFLARYDGFAPVGFSDLTDEQRDRLPEHWKSCAHLLTDEAVYSCGEAMEQALARTALVPAMLVRGLHRLPGYAALREGVYRFIAANRPWFGRLVRR